MAQQVNSCAECVAGGIVYLGHGNDFGPSGTGDFGRLCPAAPVECALLQMACHKLVADTTQLSADLHK